MLSATTASGQSCAKAGNMGVEERREMLFWTKEEYLKFADAMMDKPPSYYALKCSTGAVSGGELLALTPTDFDFEAVQCPSANPISGSRQGRDYHS